MDKVCEWATPEVRSVPPEASVREVAEEMNARDLRHMLVLERGRLVGVISRQDLMRVVFSNPGRVFDVDGCRAGDIMTPCPLITVEPEADLSEAARLMYEGNVSALPVLEGDRVAGILTTADLMRHVWHAAV